MIRALFLLLLGACLSACDRSAPTSAAAPAQTEQTMPAYVGKAWLSTTPGHAVGTMLIFLPDRTLVRGSCAGNFRIVEWGRAGEHVRWLEDAVPIEAVVEMPRPHQLQLRLAGSNERQTYVAASAPYRCP